MVRLLQIVALSLVVTLLGGCSGPEEDKPIWEQVKMGDLAAPNTAKRPSDQLSKIINFNVYIFEIPAGKIGLLDDIWRMLHVWPLQFNDYDAFCANLFSAGFGQIRMWTKISALLRDAGAKKTPTVSLLLSEGQADDLIVARLYREQPIFYTSTGGSMEGATIGPGTLSLRIKVEKIPGSRGVCNVRVHPVFSPPMMSSIPQLAARAKAGELDFICAGFRLKMSPGDFFLLAPKEYISDQMTLGSLFFTKSKSSLSAVKPERKPAIRVFLVVCTSINV